MICNLHEKLIITFFFNFNVFCSGPASWDIPETEVDYPHSIDLFRWFAYFFLKGEICDILKPFVPHLDEPKTLISPVAVR